jgi:hypothetical protein
MMIGVFLDNNIWDLLFEQKLDLAVELPREAFGSPSPAKLSLKSKPSKLESQSFGCSSAKQLVDAKFLPMPTSVLPRPGRPEIIE